MAHDTVGGGTHPGRYDGVEGCARCGRKWKKLEPGALPVRGRVGEICAECLVERMEREVIQSETAELSTRDSAKSEVRATSVVGELHLADEVNGREQRCSRCSKVLLCVGIATLTRVPAAFAVGARVAFHEDTAWPVKSGDGFGWPECDE